MKSDNAHKLPKAAKPNTLHLLTVFGVPSHLGATLYRHKFRPTKKKKTTWWRIFDPQLPTARDDARAILEKLDSLGLTERKWKDVPRKRDEDPLVQRAREIKAARLVSEQKSRQKNSAHIKAARAAAEQREFERQKQIVSKLIDEQAKDAVLSARGIGRRRR